MLTGNALPGFDAQPAIGAHTQAVGACYFMVAYKAASGENNRKQTVGEFADNGLET
jgi:hypothetical protein